MGTRVSESIWEMRLDVASRVVRFRPVPVRACPNNPDRGDSAGHGAGNLQQLQHRSPAPLRRKAFRSPKPTGDKPAGGRTRGDESDATRPGGGKPRGQPPKHSHRQPDNRQENPRESTCNPNPMQIRCGDQHGHQDKPHGAAHQIGQESNGEDGADGFQKFTVFRIPGSRTQVPPCCRRDPRRTPGSWCVREHSNVESRFRARPATLPRPRARRRRTRNGRMC